ncbi:uncharacterized protein LOC122498530 isoform X2 [Leptopilina heterotoma]|uniref:uncharacterized protein LOC122498530 isoform X2 n=1 Tax=Leptopilina heterotoma TaxID=63436 RepID=UPI001CA9B94C|nr:uncharacterized protein LOC122498530 isoform X2 [Leptopilina heterotoma]
MEKKPRNCLLLLLLLLFGAGFPTSLFFLNKSSKQDTPGNKKAIEKVSPSAADNKLDASDSQQSRNLFNISFGDNFGIIQLIKPIPAEEFYKVNCLDVNNTETESNIDNLPNEENSSFIFNLIPSSTYHLEIATCNKTSCSKPLVTEEFHTDSISDERAPPRELKVSSITDSGCIVSWKKPKNKSKLQSYTLKVWESNKFPDELSYDQSDYVHSNDEISEPLSKLKHGTNYTIVLNAVYSNGNDNSNLTANFTTLNKN